MSNRILLLKCQRNLLLTWLCGSVPAVLIMSIRTIVGNFSGYEQEIWGWFVPMFLPTLTLMLGAYSAIALKESTHQITIDKVFFNISTGVSSIYLLILNIVVIIQPFLNAPVLETTQRASLFLGLLQGLTTTCIGVFFVSQD